MIVMSRPRPASLLASIGLHAGAAALLAAIGVGAMIVRREHPRPDIVIESRFATPEDEREKAPLEVHEFEAEVTPELAEPADPLLFADLPLEPEEAPAEPPDFGLSPPPIPFGKTVVVKAAPPPSEPPPAAAAPPNPPRAPAAEAAAAASEASASAASTAPAPKTAVNRPPAYPSFARRRGLAGVVIVRARVGPDGRCAFALVVTTSGHAVLDEAALDAVRTWKFEPARDASGAAVAGEIDLPIRFELTAAPPRAE